MRLVVESRRKIGPELQRLVVALHGGCMVAAELLRVAAQKPDVGIPLLLSAARVAQLRVRRDGFRGPAEDCQALGSPLERGGVARIQRKRSLERVESLCELIQLNLEMADAYGNRGVAGIQAAGACE